MLDHPSRFAYNTSVCFVLEVTHISKQGFLAELGKLLTFMYEEDRQTALSMYSDMFDDAEDDTALAQFLASPTRQAVLVARSYNSKDHKLLVRAQAKGENAVADQGTLTFVTMIEDLRKAAEEKNIVRVRVDEKQFSLFEAADEAAPDPATPAEEAEPAEAQPVSLFDDAAPAAVIPAEEASEVPAEAEPAAPAADEAAEEVQPDGASEEDAPADDALPSAAETAEAPVEASEAAEAAEEPESPAAEEPVAPTGTVRKPKVFLLILYTLFAIPVAIAGIAILLVPALVCLVTAGATIVTAVLAAMAALTGGFGLLADILLVVGGALVLLGIGLLFLWLFVWFIICAMAGHIRGLRTLGSKWCYKEVAAA